MKRIKIALYFLSIAILYSCKSETEENNEIEAVESVSAIQVQGHRGDRGNFPENTIPAFISAVKKGVDVIELDVVISRDKKVIVSHEPYMSSWFVTSPTGDSIKKSNERTYNIYKMSYDSIRQYDVGSRGNSLFPKQQKIRTYKPLLSEVIDTVEAFVAAEGLLPVYYNIELKSVEAEYGKYQPQPEEFVELVMSITREKGITDKIYIQSFDPNILNLINESYPETKLVYLVNKKGIKKNLSRLSFKPDVYSPNFKLVKNKQFVDSIRSLNMKLIPWTVNENKTITRMINLKVDGIITDYPERVLQRKKKASLMIFHLKRNTSLDCEILL